MGKKTKKKKKRQGIPIVDGESNATVLVALDIAIDT